MKTQEDNPTTPNHDIGSLAEELCNAAALVSCIRDAAIYIDVSEDIVNAIDGLHASLVIMTNKAYVLTEVD
jgi:hypothetical protein